MTVASLAGVVYKTGWYFFALGPQMVICILGVLIMFGLWWRAGAAMPEGSADDREPPA